jgi:predicted acyltransferase
MRDPARDALRGLNALEMTFVNISKLQWTAHSPYVGQITYADTIFPCFAFLSGMSPTPTRRSVGLVGLGLGLETVSAFANGRAIRIPGVLQRLGVASIIANEPSLAFLHKFYGLPLIGLWSAISLLGSSSSVNPLAHPDFPSADPLDTAQTKIDKFLFGSRLHRPTFDPEGLLGALTTAVSMLVGQVFSQSNFSTTERLVGSISMIALGEALHFSIPKYAAISKSLWTPSFVLVTSGCSILKYLSVEILLPYLPSTIRSMLEATGKRSLEVYFLSYLLSVALQYGGSESIWSRALAGLEIRVGKSYSDFILSLGLAGLMAASASFLVSQRLRLQW